MLRDAEYWKEHVVDQRTEEEKTDRYGEVVPIYKFLQTSNSYEILSSISDTADILEKDGYTADYMIVDHVSSPKQIRDYLLMGSDRMYDPPKTIDGCDYFALHCTNAEGKSITPVVGGISPYGNTFYCHNITDPETGTVKSERTLDRLIKAEQDTYGSIEKKAQNILKNYPSEVKALTGHKPEAPNHVIPMYSNYGRLEGEQITYTQEEIAKMIAAARLSDQQIHDAAKWEINNEGNFIFKKALTVNDIIRLAKEDNLGKYEEVADGVLEMADHDSDLSGFTCYDWEHEMLACGQERQDYCIQKAIPVYATATIESAEELIRFWKKESSRRPDEGRAEAMDRATATVFYLAVGLGHEKSTLHNLRAACPGNTLKEYANDPVFYDPNQILKEIADHGTIKDLMNLFNNPKGYPAREDVSAIYQELKKMNPEDIHVNFRDVSPKDFVALGHAINRSTVMSEDEKSSLKSSFYHEILKGNKDVTKHLFIKPGVQDMLYRLRNDKQAALGLRSAKPEDLGKELRFHVMRQELERRDVPTERLTLERIRQNEEFINDHFDPSTFEDNRYGNQMSIQTQMYGTHKPEIQRMSQELYKKQFSVHVSLFREGFQKSELPELVSEAVSKHWDSDIIQSEINWMIQNEFLFINDDGITHNSIEALKKEMYISMQILISEKIIQQSTGNEKHLPSVTGDDLKVTDSFVIFGGDGPASFDNRGGTHNYNVNGITVYKEHGTTRSIPANSQWAHDAYTDFDNTTSLNQFTEYVRKHAPAFAYMASHHEIIGSKSELRARVTDLERQDYVSKEAEADIQLSGNINIDDPDEDAPMM